MNAASRPDDGPVIAAIIAEGGDWPARPAQILWASIGAYAGTALPHARLCARAVDISGADHDDAGACHDLLVDVDDLAGTARYDASRARRKNQRNPTAERALYETLSLTSALGEFLRYQQQPSWNVVEVFTGQVVEHIGLPAWLAAYAQQRGVTEGAWDVAAQLLRGGLPLDDTIDAATLIAAGT